MLKRSTLRRTCLFLCAIALFFLHTSPSLAAEGGAGWSFSDDGTLTLTRKSGANDPPYNFDWHKVKTLRLGPAVEDFLLCDDLPWFLPEKIWVNSQNPYFVVENRMLIDLRENKVVCAQIDVVDAVIPDYITEIGAGAFARHSNLQTVALPDGLLRIMEDAFWRCASLQEIHLPDSLQLLVSSFWECTGLTSVTIPAGADMNSSFESCVSLTKVTFADGAVSTGRSTFWDCTALTAVHLPDSIRTIELGAFYGCTSLETLRLPASLEKVERRAFEDCISLKVLDFPDHVIIEPGALPYELPTPSSIPAPTTTPKIVSAAVSQPEMPSPSVPTEQGSFWENQLLLVGLGVLIAVNVVAIVVVWRRKRQAVRWENAQEHPQD